MEINLERHTYYTNETTGTTEPLEERSKFNVINAFKHKGGWRIIKALGNKTKIGYRPND